MDKKNSLSFSKKYYNKASIWHYTIFTEFHEGHPLMQNESCIEKFIEVVLCDEIFWNWSDGQRIKPFIKSYDLQSRIIMLMINW
jgi:hypothetical protein